MGLSVRYHAREQSAKSRVVCGDASIPVGALGRWLSFHYVLLVYQTAEHC